MVGYGAFLQALFGFGFPAAVIIVLRRILARSLSMQMAEYLRRRDTFIETEVSLVFWEHLKTGEPISEQQCDHLAQEAVASARERWAAMLQDPVRQKLADLEVPVTGNQ